MDRVSAVGIGAIASHYSRATVGPFKCRRRAPQCLSRLYNADNSLSSRLFAVNPEFEELVLPLGDWKGCGGNWLIMTDLGFDDVPFRNDLNGELLASARLWFVDGRCLEERYLVGRKLAQIEVYAR